MKAQQNLEFLPSSYLSWFLASSLNAPINLFSFIPFLEEANFLYLLLSAKLLISCFYLNAYSSKKIYPTTPPEPPLHRVLHMALSYSLLLSPSGLFVHSFAFLHPVECKFQKNKHCPSESLSHPNFYSRACHK